MNSDDSSSSGPAGFYMDDQTLEVARYFTGDAKAKQRSYLLRLQSEQMSEQLLNLLSGLQPSPKNELLYVALITRNFELLDGARQPELLNVALGLENAHARAGLVRMMLCRFEDLEVLKKFLKTLPFADVKTAITAAAGLPQQFTHIIHSNFAKQLVAHLEYCTTGRGCPLWERSAPRVNKPTPETLQMLLSDRAAVVFSVLIATARGDAALENSTLGMFELYECELVKRRQAFPGLLYIINLISASFQGYFAAQSTLFTLLKHAYRPLPYAAFSVNISAYRGKMFDQQGRMRFFEQTTHPAGLTDSSLWFEELRAAVIQSILLYVISAGGIADANPLKMVTLPEVASWLLMQVCYLGEALSGGRPVPGTSEFVSYGRIQKQEMPKYQKQLKELKTALQTDCAAVEAARAELCGAQELKALFSSDKVPPALSKRLKEIAADSAAAKLYYGSVKAASAQGVQQDEQQAQIAQDDGFQTPEVQEESFEPVEGEEDAEESEEPRDVVRDLQL